MDIWKPKIKHCIQTINNMSWYEKRNRIRSIMGSRYRGLQVTSYSQWVPGALKSLKFIAFDIYFEYKMEIWKSKIKHCIQKYKQYELIRTTKIVNLDEKNCEYKTNKIKLRDSTTNYKKTKITNTLILNSNVKTD